MALDRPHTDEYVPYYSTYVDKVPDGPLLDTLAREIETTLELLARVEPERETYRYEPGKWSLREVVGHIIDVERLFSFRALWFARANAEPQPGMEQDEWMAASNFHHRPLAELAEELRTARAASLPLYAGFAPEAHLVRGVASGFEFSVRAMPWIAAGHEIHHRRVIEQTYLR